MPACHAAAARVVSPTRADSEAICNMQTSAVPRVVPRSNLVAAQL